MKKNISLILLTSLLISIAPRASAVLRAYEGFDYPGGTDVSTANALNGGFGWSAQWYDLRDPNAAYTDGAGVSVIIPDSLSYTDALNRVLVTTGNKALNIGTNGTSRPWRPLTNLWSAANTTNWVSFLGVRTGTNFVRGANLSLFNLTNYTINFPTSNGIPVASRDANGRLAMGENSSVADDTWAIAPNGRSPERRSSTNSITNLVFFVIRIEHSNDGNEVDISTNDFDKVYAWLNPPLGSEPSATIAFTNIISDGTNSLPPISAVFGYDFAFDSVILFAGSPQGGGATPAGEWLLDEIRIGDSYADVAPFTGGPANLTARWTNAVVTGNNISLTLTGAVSTTYRVVSRTSLSSGSWSVVGNLNTGANGVGSITDTNALATQPAKYYGVDTP